MTEENRAVPNREPRYEVVDKDGLVVGGSYMSAQDAAIHAKCWWPDQEQDEERTGKGWDVQVVGSE